MTNSRWSLLSVSLCCASCLVKPHSSQGKGIVLWYVQQVWLEVQVSKDTKFYCRTNLCDVLLGRVAYEKQESTPRRTSAFRNPLDFPREKHLELVSQERKLNKLINSNNWSGYDGAYCVPRTTLSFPAHAAHQVISDGQSHDRTAMPLCVMVRASALLDRYLSGKDNSRSWSSHTRDTACREDQEKIK